MNELIHEAAQGIILLERAAVNPDRVERAKQAVTGAALLGLGGGAIGGAHGLATGLRYRSKLSKAKTEARKVAAAVEKGRRQQVARKGLKGTAAQNVMNVSKRFKAKAHASIKKLPGSFNDVVGRTVKGTSKGFKRGLIPGALLFALGSRESHELGRAGIRQVLMEDRIVSSRERFNTDRAAVLGLAGSGAGALSQKVGSGLRAAHKTFRAGSERIAKDRIVMPQSETLLKRRSQRREERAGITRSRNPITGRKTSVGNKDKRLNRVLAAKGSKEPQIRVPMTKEQAEVRAARSKRSQADFVRRSTKARFRRAAAEVSDVVKGKGPILDNSKVKTLKTLFKRHLDSPTGQSFKSGYKASRGGRGALLGIPVALASGLTGRKNVAVVAGSKKKRLNEAEGDGRKMVELLRKERERTGIPAKSGKVARRQRKGYAGTVKRQGSKSFRSSLKANIKEPMTVVQKVKRLAMKHPIKTGVGLSLAAMAPEATAIAIALRGRKDAKKD